MAIYRFYLSSVTGNGSMFNPYRAVIPSVLGPAGINPSKGLDNRYDWNDLIVDHKFDSLRFGLLGGEQSHHNSISGIAGVSAVGSSFSASSISATMNEAPTNLNAIQDVLNLPRKSLPSVRECIKQITHTIRFTQRMKNKSLDSILNFVNQNRNATLGSFPAPQKNAALNLLIAEGYDLSTVTDSMTVGQLFDLVSSQSIDTQFSFGLIDFNTGQSVNFTLDN